MTTREKNRSLTALLVLLGLIGPGPTLGRTRRGDILVAQAHAEEAKDTTAALDAALDMVKQAFETDRTDIGYQLEVARLKAFAAQYHVYDGQDLRDKKKLNEALGEFQKAAQLDPASIVAPQEVDRTQALIRELVLNPQLKIEDALMRPLPRKNKMDEARFSQTMPLAQLKVKLSGPLPMIKVNNQSSTEVFLAVAKDDHRQLGIV